MPATIAPAAPALRRALGRWDLTAIGVNQVIGGAIFLAKTAAFVAPLGPVVPIVAILVCVGIAAGATRQQLLGGAAALSAGAAMFAIQTGLRAKG